MERTNGGLSSKRAVLIPVSKSSDVFEKVLAPLQNSYLYGESTEAFKYTSAFLFNNSTLQKKYEAFRANRREAGYSEKELKEGYGFLLFDDINKATELGETGVLTGNSLCKTLGDPSKGVYIAKYSDCLAPDHWYCGKSGFIVILRLTKGRINKVKENYTQNCIAPSVGFDCHESKDLPMVSANTSSFLAYERTQYYLYERLPGECSQENLSPSHVCPFAIVPFSYVGVNTKATMSSLEQSGTEERVFNNIMWRGQLHISSQIFHVRLKSRLGSLIPVKLPPVVKVDGAVSMVTLRQFAPKAVFETHFSGEVSLEGICCNVQEFVPLEVGDTSLSLLIRELKDKDLGLTVHLNESGFLILLHSSNFAMSSDNKSSVTEALQAMFLFPGSRAIQKDTKGELEESQISSDILQILPALDYAETEMQKSSTGPSEDTSGQFVQQIKNYAAHLQTGLAATPSKDISPLSKDYDEALTPLSSNPKWTSRLWQWLRSYLSHPVSFQLPVYSVSELLEHGNTQKEVLNEEVCLSPREQTPGTTCSLGQEELSSKSTAHISSNWQMDVEKKDSETNSLLNCTLSRNPTAELVVSIISAEGTSKVIDNSLSGSDAVVTKQLSQSPIAKTNTVDKNPLENSTDRKKLPRGRPKGKRKFSKKSSSPADEPLTFTSEKPDEERLQPAQCTLADDSSETEWTILSMSQCKGGKLTYKYKKVPRSPQLQEDEIKNTRPRRMGKVPSTGLGAGSLPRNTDRCDLRPILTGCGRTLVPHGSLNGCLQKKESTDCGQRLNETVSRTSEEEMDLDPVDGRLSVTTTINKNAGEKCHNTEAGSHLETSSCLLECGDHSLVNIAEPDSSNSLPSSTADDSPHLKGQERSEHLICKLKKLFSGRKRKDPQLGLGDSLLPVDAQLSAEPSLKKCKADMDREMLHTESNTDRHHSREESKSVLRTAFAQALGLMPTKMPVTLEETKITDTLQKPLPVGPDCKIIPPEVQSSQLMIMVPSPIQQKLQVNHLLQKRPQQWVTCFHTPVYTISNGPQNKVCAKSISFSSGQTNALILLADLALGNVNNQAQPQPDPCAMTKLDPRLDLNNQPIDATKPIIQSVLPSMLKQPADIPILPNSQSPEGLLGSNDVINSIAKEHDYSLSATSEMPKTSAPAGMPQHSQNLSGQEMPALCNEPPEGPSDHKASVEQISKDAISSRRFRRSRIFVEKDGFLQVTRKWKGNYNFDLDSKFTNHPVEKTVCRGLHGSWNCTVKDSGEETQLLIHMWIGLFYSRSTPRFIHSSPLDLMDGLERSDTKVLSPTVRETAAVSIGNAATQDLEPTKEDGLISSQGVDILDLSIKKQVVNDSSDIAISRQETNGKDASEASVSEAKIQDEGPAQCQANLQPLKVYSSLPRNFDDHNEGTNDYVPHSATKVSAVNSLSEDKTCDSLCKVIENIIHLPRLVAETNASIHPESCNKERSERQERKENTEVAVDLPMEMDKACEIIRGIVEDPNPLRSNLVGTKKKGLDESKCDHQSNADSSLPVINNNDSTMDLKSPMRYVILSDNETQSTNVGFITHRHGSNENGNEYENRQSASYQGHFTTEEDNNSKPKSIRDGHGTIRGNDPRESCQSSPVRQSFEENGKTDASPDDTLLMQCANSTAPMAGDDEGNAAEDDTISKEKSNIALDKSDMLPAEPEDKESTGSKMYDSTLAGLEVESQAEELPDVSVVSSAHHEQEVQTAYDLCRKAASHHHAESSQDGVSNLLQDPRALPVVVKDDSKQEVIAGPHLQDNSLEAVKEPKETAMNIDVCSSSLEIDEKVPIAEDVLEDGDSTHTLGSEAIEVDKRCPTQDGPGVNCQLSLVGPSYDSDGKEDASSEEMLKTIGGGDQDNAKGDDTIAEENVNIALDTKLPLENGNNDSIDKANSDIWNQQNKSDNGTSSLQGGILVERRAEVLPKKSVVCCDHHELDDEMVENEVETADNLAEKAASHHQDGSRQDVVSKIPQGPRKLPIVGKDRSDQEGEAGTQPLPLHNPVELVNDPKAMAMSIDDYHTSLENCGKVLTAAKVLPAFAHIDSKNKLESENIEVDKSCLTPTKWDGPGILCQLSPVRQPYEGNGKEDESGQVMLQTPCTNAMSDGDDTIPEEMLNTALDKTLHTEQDGDSRHQSIIEIVSQQNRSDNDCTPLQESSEVLPDMSVFSCDPQKSVDELIENEVETTDILVSNRQAYSLKDEVSKLLQDQNERPLVGKDDSKQEEEAGLQVLPLQANAVPVSHFEPKEKAMYMNVDGTLNGEKVPMSENVLSVFEDSDSKRKLGSEDCEVDERCSTHTKVDGPVVHCRATLVLQSYEGECKKDPSSKEMLQRPCANTIAFMGGGDNYDCNDALPEENMNIVLDKTLPEESDHNDSMDEANLDILSKQNKPENDSAESQAEVLQDVSVSCDHHEHGEELIESTVETAYKLAEKADMHPQSQPPQDEVSKWLKQSEMHSLCEDSLGEAATQVLPFKADTLEMGKEPELPMTMNVYEMSQEKIFSVFDESNYEHELGSETSEYDERCPTPTVDENPYEDFPCLALSISGESSPENLTISPEEITGTTLGNSVEQELGKEVHEQPELDVVRDQDPGRDLGEENHTLSNRMLEINELPLSLNQSPESTQRKSMDIDRSPVYVGVTTPKQLTVKRKISFEEGFSVFVPCPPKKFSNHPGKCDAPVQSRSRPCTNSPVVATLLDNQRDISTCSLKDNQHENELEICSNADRVSDHGVGEGVWNKQNSIDALHNVKERGPWEPSRTVPATASAPSEDGMLSSSSFQDPVDKILGHPSSIHTDPSTSSFEYTNYKFTKTVSKSFGPITERGIHSDLTQFSMEQEFLIFTEEMKRLLTGSNRCPGKNPNQGSMRSYPSSCGPQSVLDLSMDEDLPESAMEETGTVGEKIPNHCESSSRINRAEANVVLSKIEAECARSYHTMMDNVCAGRSRLTEPDGALRDHAGTSRQKRSEMFGSLNQGLNLVVRRSSKTKFRFFMLKTSEDAIFGKTKVLLEADGHTEVRPMYFFPEKQGSTSSLLLIILKNEDIAEHIIKVPYLLRLKKSANVLFAGIDQPEDIRNLTHQDLFKKGGFIMLEGTALEALSFCQMKALMDFLEELSKNGKWKWILHYRDIRRLKENTRLSAEDTEKRHLIKSCQDSGIVEVLPYHECDQMDRPHPRYLKCLLQLQVQNISARFPVFVTNTTHGTEEATFARHGILTMNINSLLTVIESEDFSSSTSI